MGAFGELLIQTMGGDLDSYRGNHTKKTKTKKVSQRKPKPPKNYVKK